MLQQPRGKRTLGPGQRPHEGKPEHDEHEAGDLELRALVDGAPDRRRGSAERDEDDREADDERQAREHDLP